MGVKVWWKKKDTKNRENPDGEFSKNYKLYQTVQKKCKILKFKEIVDDPDKKTENVSNPEKKHKQHMKIKREKVNNLYLYITD